MQGLKLIIFDLDGTLVDAYPAIYRSFNYVMQKLGYPIQDRLTIRRQVGWGDKNLLRPFIKLKDLKETIALYRSHHKNALLKGAAVFPKVRIVLSQLKKRGYKLAVASNRPTHFSWILIRNLRLDKYFDYVLCADKLKQIKPHPEILHKIMRRFSFHPQESLYVGDMVIDIQAGKWAKVKTIAVTTGSSTKQELKKEKPYRIISNIAKLLNEL